jgi:ubiquinol-cytochrome c reductase cytochrome c1 subunit
MTPMKTIIALVILVLSFGAQAVEGGFPLQKADVDIFDLASVRRGAGYFVDYCMGCHSIKHLRYSRVGRDLELKDDVLRKDIMPEGAKVHESFLTSMDAADAVKWFGVAPPDLSLVARARGADWLYSYLKGFYIDQSPTRPTGVNNLYFKDVAMPNVFWDLQGLQKPVINSHEGNPVIERLEKVTKGKLSDKEFDQTMTDLVTFLVYAAEPAQYSRLSLGKYVIFVLLVLAVILFKLKKEYWKDIK